MKFVTSRGRRADERAHEQKAASPVMPCCSVEGRQVIEDYERYKEYRTRFYARYDPVEDPWAPDGEVIFIPVPLPGDLARSDEILWRTAKKIGLNAMKTFYYVPGATSPITKYGDNESQFNDCAALGVKVIRQFGLADLLWGMLAGRDAEVPLESGLEPSILSDENKDRIAQLFTEAHRTRTKVIFTFLTLGGGGAALDSDFVPDPMREMDAVPKLRWSTAHIGQEASGYPFDYFTAGTRDTIDNWILNSLDVRSGYKRHYFKLIAQHCVTLLIAALDEAKNQSILDDAVSLSDVVEGIEIFNEIDTRCRIYERFYDNNEEYSYEDSAMQAYWWALAYTECAEAFRLGLSSEIPILLPGLSSYLSEKGFSWDDKFRFLEDFCGQIRFQARARGLSPYDIAGGLDYHWYHRKTGEATHIGYLIQEVKEIQSLLDSYISKDCRITVMETGVAVKADFSPLVKRNRFSTKLKNSERLEHSLFQSNEVWRRLGGVLASGATAAGWHSWMSGIEDAFEYMGLRVDGTPSQAPAVQAQPRPSWFSFARLSEVLSEVFAGQMLLPAISSLSDLAGMTKADGLVVLEFMVSSTPFGLHRYAYLVFYDPTGAANGATVEVYSAFSVVQASLVSTRVNGQPTSSGGSATTLPTSVATFDPDALFTVPAVVKTYKEDSPLLILANQRLRWTNVEAFEAAKP
ncbi:hypothetical protein L6R46_22705 [Myxococcota bacterium]|nr:hypothetical protein [Myxococcota bacterium]